MASFPDIEWLSKVSLKWDCRITQKLDLKNWMFLAEKLFKLFRNGLMVKFQNN